MTETTWIVTKIEDRISDYVDYEISYIKRKKEKFFATAGNEKDAWEIVDAIKAYRQQAGEP
jgi:hypothetical protein